jgi:hypothetical protein
MALHALDRKSDLDPNAVFISGGTLSDGTPVAMVTSHKPNPTVERNDLLADACAFDDMGPALLKMVFSFGSAAFERGIEDLGIWDALFAAREAALTGDPELGRFAATMADVLKRIHSVPTLCEREAAAGREIYRRAKRDAREAALVAVEVAESVRLDAIRQEAIAEAGREDRERAAKRAAEKEGRRREAERRAAESAERERQRRAAWPTKGNRAETGRAA